MVENCGAEKSKFLDLCHSLLMDLGQDHQKYPTVHSGASRKHSSLRKESPVEVMLLDFIWDETASGIARSNTENGLHSWSAPHFCMGWDCLWDSQEQHREWTEQLICSLFIYGTRLPIGQQGATQRINGTADLLLPWLWDETSSGTGRSTMLVILTLLSPGP